MPPDNSWWSPSCVAHPLNSVEENFTRFIDPDRFSSDDEEEDEEGEEGGKDDGEDEREEGDDEDGNGEEEQGSEMDEEGADNPVHEIEKGEEQSQAETPSERNEEDGAGEDAEDKDENVENEEEEEEDVGEGLQATPTSFERTDEQEAKEKEFEEDSEQKGADQNAKDDATLASAEESLHQLLNEEDEETEHCETSSLPENNHSTIRALPSPSLPPQHSHSLFSSQWHQQTSLPSITLSIERIPIRGNHHRQFPSLIIDCRIFNKKFNEDSINRQFNNPIIGPPMITYAALETLPYLLFR